jgi:hypothetical protein
MLGCLMLAAAQEERSPVPSSTEQKKTRTTIRELLKEDYAGNDLPSRKALARKLLAQGEATRNDKVAHYVLLMEARDVAVTLPDVETALAAIDRLAETFEVDPIELKIKTLGEARRKVRTEDAGVAVAAGFLATAKAAMAAGDYTAASRAAKEAERVAKAARDATIAAEARQLTKEIPELKREAETAAKAELRLSANPDDTEASLALGHHLCFVKGEWEKGLPHLANGGVAEVTKAANQEVSNPAEPEAQVKVGDAWWAAAEKERGALHKRRYLDRAAHWYEKAWPNLDGLARMKLDKRLEEYDKQTGSKVIDLLAMIDPAKIPECRWRRQGRALVSGREEWTPLPVPYALPAEYDLHLVVTRMEGINTLFFKLVGGGRPFALFLGGGDEGLTSGVDFVDGKRFWENETSHSGQIFQTGRPQKLIFFVRRRHFILTVNGKKVIDWAADFSKVSMEPHMKIGAPEGPGISTHETSFRISRMILIPVSGRGRPLRLEFHRVEEEN